MPSHRPRRRRGCQANPRRRGLRTRVGFSVVARRKRWRARPGRPIDCSRCLPFRTAESSRSRAESTRETIIPSRSIGGRKGKTCMRQIPIVGSSRDERQVPLVGGVGPGPGDAQHKHQQPGPSPSLMSMATAVRSPATPLRTTSMEGTCCRCYSVRLLVV
ncbi:hypothetical protein BDA96_04G077500 [Sorghum bicolor]|nr:hypothetical protein BDA96_04G077500 [Sorghum bicolor]